MRRPGQVLTPGPAARGGVGLGYEQRSNVVEVYVRYLREKIDRPFGVRSIETVRGVGYRLRKDGGGVSRLPIRVRLTALFALAMVARARGRRAVRLRPPARPTSTRASTSALETRAAAVAASGQAAAGAAGDAEEGFAQLLGADGRVLVAHRRGARRRR